MLLLCVSISIIGRYRLEFIYMTIELLTCGALDAGTAPTAAAAAVVVVVVVVVVALIILIVPEEDTCRR